MFSQLSGGLARRPPMMEKQKWAQSVNCPFDFLLILAAPFLFSVGAAISWQA
jgi:hypothetical protein